MRVNRSFFLSSFILAAFTMGCSPLDSAEATLALSSAADGPVASLTLFPSSVAGGSGAVPRATVTLGAPAPAGGQSVNLASSLPALATGPASVVVPEGAISTTFPVSTNARYRRFSGLGFSVTMTASTSAGAATATLQVTAQAKPIVQEARADSSGTFCGGPGTDVVDGDGGVLFGCTASRNPSMAGLCTALLECSNGCQSVAPNGFHHTDRCAAGPATALSLTPNVVVAGTPVMGTYSLAAPAPSFKDVNVFALSRQSTGVSAPFDNVLPAGQQSLSFPITTAVPAGFPVFAQISAVTHDLPGPSDSAWLTVVPAVGCTPNTTATCVSLGCGTLPDGCGGTIQCGCPAGQTCSPFGFCF
jgi:hypothetical protein